MPPIKPCLWFDHQAEEAARFYTSIFPNSRVVRTSKTTDAGPGPEGSVLTVDFVLDGREIQALNGGPVFQFSPAISLTVEVETQDELDRYWDALLDGGKPSQCGWLEDRYGLSWQIVPKRLGELMTGDPKAAGRVMRAVLQMVKLDIATLERAARG